MQRVMVVLVVSMVATMGLVAASSFTSATLSRDANIDVVSDSTSIIALTDGNSGGIVQQQSDGKLTIDFDVSGSGTGVNPDSTYNLGDPTNVNNEHAFAIVNHDTVAHDIEMEFTPGAGDGNSDDNVVFHVYDKTHNEVITVSDETGTAYQTLSSGERLRVVVVVDTTVGSVSTGTDLSGTLDISAI